jgi:hypothetical protein
VGVLDHEEGGSVHQLAEELCHDLPQLLGPEFGVELCRLRRFGHVDVGDRSHQRCPLWEIAFGQYGGEPLPRLGVATVVIDAE